MVTMNIPSVQKHDKYIGDGSTYEFYIPTHAVDVEVMLEGVYLTKDEDFTYSSGVVTLIEVPFQDDNINIRYKI
jgi:hypothetical protein